MEHMIKAALAVGAQHLLYSAVLFGFALWLMRIRAVSAELRSWLLLAIFALAIVLPLASFLPAWSTTAYVLPPEPPSFLPLPAEGARPNEQVFEAGKNPDAIHLEVPRSLSSALVLIWMLGALWQWMRLFDGWLQARRLSRSAHPAPLLETALADALPRNARIATTAVDGPMVVGLLHPRILIPRALTSTLEPETLHDIVRHEIAHIRRCDLWLTAALRAVMALFWWNPLLRMINERLDLAREMACDARAAQACDARVDYAGSLLASTEKLLELGEQRSWLAVGMFEHRSHLAQRIDGLIEEEGDNTSTRRELPMMLYLILYGCALFVCAGIAVATGPRIDPHASSAAEPDVQVLALLMAAGNGDTNRVRELVQNGADIDARALGQGTALIQAVRSRNLATVDTLLELGADPNRASLGEGNPLIVASRMGLQPIVERLISAGADINRVVTYDETPLINAARSGHLTTVRYLVEHGANVNLGVEADGWLGRWRTPLNQTQDPAVRAYLTSQGAIAGKR